MSRTHYIAAYDVSDPRRLRRVARLLRDYGSAVQKSVCLCRLNRRQRLQLQAEVAELMDPAEDRFLLAPLHDPAAMHTLGAGAEMAADGLLYLE